MNNICYIFALHSLHCGQVHEICPRPDQSSHGGQHKLIRWSRTDVGRQREVSTERKRREWGGRMCNVLDVLLLYIVSFPWGPRLTAPKRSSGGAPTTPPIWILQLAWTSRQWSPAAAVVRRRGRPSCRSRPPCRGAAISAASPYRQTLTTYYFCKKKNLTTPPLFHPWLRIHRYCRLWLALLSEYILIILWAV